MKAFVMMPFSEEFDDVFKIGIKETAEKEGVRAYRLDEELFNEGMLEKIYSEIESADFIIADLSNRNPNVFYELGYAHAIGKLCILITESADNIPFDLKHRRHIVYGGKLTYLQEHLQSNIKWAKNEIETQKNNPFHIELQADGNLESTDEYAKGNIDFVIDIENRSNRVSPEIQGIYIYSEQQWIIRQNGKSVPSKKSELKPYKFKYSLSFETSKIPRKGFTQLELTASRFIAYAFEGEKISNRYTITGSLFIDVVTDKGSYSNKFPISVYLDTLPF